MPCVLVVDDEENQRKSLAIALRLEGYEVLEAADGVDALALIGAGGIAVAVVDMIMPRMSGLELARWIRLRTPEVGLVLVSAYQLSERQLARAQVDSAVFVPKPYRVDAVLGAIGRQLSRDHRRQAG